MLKREVASTLRQTRYFTLKLQNNIRGCAFFIQISVTTRTRLFIAKTLNNRSFILSYPAILLPTFKLTPLFKRQNAAKFSLSNRLTKFPQCNWQSLSLLCHAHENAEVTKLLIFRLCF